MGVHDHAKNIYIMSMEGVWHRGMIKVKGVVAMWAASRSQGRGKQPWAVNKLLVESPTWVASEYRGYCTSGIDAC